MEPIEPPCTHPTSVVHRYSVGLAIVCDDCSLVLTRLKALPEGALAAILAAWKDRTRPRTREALREVWEPLAEALDAAEVSN